MSLKKLVGLVALLVVSMAPVVSAGESGAAPAAPGDQPAFFAAPETPSASCLPDSTTPERINAQIVQGCAQLHCWTNADCNAVCGPSCSGGTCGSYSPCIGIATCRCNLC